MSSLRDRLLVWLLLCMAQSCLLSGLFPSLLRRLLFEVVVLDGGRLVGSFRDLRCSRLRLSGRSLTLGLGLLSASGDTGRPLLFCSRHSHCFSLLFALSLQDQSGLPLSFCGCLRLRCSLGSLGLLLE